MTHAARTPKMTPSLLALAAALLALGTSTAQAQEVKPGNAQDGARKAAMCIGCHGIKGYKATFPEVYNVPMISGQSAKYIVNSLVAYQKGERKHPTMRGISITLTEQDMADLGVYYEGHAKGVAAPAPEKVAEAPASVAPLLAKGACSSCHGVNYSKGIDASYPKLAGQHADYLYSSLKGYKQGAKGTHGRDNAIMGGQAKPYTHAELKAMAKYLASLPGEMATVPQNKFISR
jgi:cytochrome c553